MIPSSKIVCTWGEWVDQPSPPFQQLLAGGPITTSVQKHRPGARVWDKIEEWKSFRSEFKELFSDLLETKFVFEALPTWERDDLELFQRTERGVEFVFTIWHSRVIQQAIKVVCRSFVAHSLLQTDSKQSGSSQWPKQVAIGPDAIAFTDKQLQAFDFGKFYPDWAVTTSDTHFTEELGRNILPGETKRTTFALAAAIKALNRMNYERKEQDPLGRLHTSPNINVRAEGVWVADVVGQAEGYSGIHDTRMFFVLTNRQFGIFRRSLGPEPISPSPYKLRNRTTYVPTETPSKSSSADHQRRQTSSRSFRKKATETLSEGQSFTPTPASTSSLLNIADLNLGASDKSGRLQNPVNAKKAPSSEHSKGFYGSDNSEESQGSDSSYRPTDDPQITRDDGVPQSYTIDWKRKEGTNMQSVCEALAGTILMTVDLQRRGENKAYPVGGYNRFVEDFVELRVALKELRDRHSIACSCNGCSGNTLL